MHTEHGLHTKQTSHPYVKLLKSVTRPLSQGCNEGCTGLLVLSRCMDGIAEDNAGNGPGGEMCRRGRVCQQFHALLGKGSEEAGVVVALCATSKHDVGHRLHQQQKTLSANQKLGRLLQGSHAAGVTHCINNRRRCQQL